MKFRVVEIFSSIEGEGKRSGQLATFIRLAGCNLHCSYCDTDYAQKFSDGKEWDISQILDIVRKMGNRNITLTGGEPLAAAGIEKLIGELEAAGNNINIETNGSISLKNFLSYTSTFITMDWKTPSSGYSDVMDLKNFKLLRQRDVLKIVLAEEDFNAVFNVLQARRTRAKIYLSPVYGKIEPCLLVPFARRIASIPWVKPQNLHVQVQLHKVLWPASAKGV